MLCGKGGQITNYWPGNAVSQVSTRLITFALNLATARLLSVSSYGVCLSLQAALTAL